MGLKIRLVFLIFFYFGFSTFLLSQSYSNEQKRYLNKLNHECLNEIIKNGVSDCIIGGTVYTIHKNNDNRIGLKVFSEKFYNCDPVYSFIESELLKFILNSDNERNLRRLEDGVNIYYKDCSQSFSLLSKSCDIISVINDLFDVEITYSNMFYNVVISNKKGYKLAITFPAVCSLIMEMDKKELVDNLITKLKSYKCNFTKNETTNRYKQIQDGEIYIYKGEKYIIDNMKSDTYFKRVIDSLIPVFETNYIIYSISNLILLPTSFSSERVLKLRIKNYESSYEELELKLKDFLLFFNPNYKKYFGIEYCNPANLRGCLIFYNEKLNYIHLVDIETTTKDLFNNSGIFKGTLYSYIPTHDFKS